jgi:UV DNA damage endonuclease
MIRLGYLCQNHTLKELGIKGNRTLIRKNYSLDRVKALSLMNIEDLSDIFEWNHLNNIHLFRITSDIFPHFTDMHLEDVKNGSYNMEFAVNALKKAGEDARKYNQRVVMHPGQYNQIGAKERSIFESTIKDLTMHADLLDYMGMGPESVICVHGGGVYGDKEKTKERWIEQFHELPENVKKRVAIENCERCYSVKDCVEIAEACGIPMIFDCHHYECWNLIYKNDNMNIEEWMPRIVETWRRRGVTPLFHISEQAVGERIGTHSEFVEKLPSYYLHFPEKYGDLDIEVEAGAKEMAVFHLRDRL